MQMPTPIQINVGLRQAAQYAAGGASVLVALGAIPADSAQNLIAGVGQIVDGLNQIVHGFGTVTAVLGPVVAGVLGKIALSRSTPKAQGAALSAAAQDDHSPNAQDAKTAILKAVTELPPEIKIPAPIIAPPEIANAIPSNKVVAP